MGKANIFKRSAFSLIFAVAFALQTANANVCLDTLKPSATKRISTAASSAVAKTTDAVKKNVLGRLNVSYEKPAYTQKELDALMETIIKKYSWEPGKSEEFKIIERFLRDPDGVIKEMENRFQAEKARSGNPYNFNYADVAAPILKTNLEQLQKADGLMKELLAQNAKIGSRSEINMIEKFYSELTNEISTLLTQPEISYIQTMRLTNSTGRFLGYLAEKGFLALDKNQHITARYWIFLKIVDRSVQGYRVKTIQQEYEMYRRPVTTLLDILSFDKKSILPNYNKNAKHFYEQLARTDELPFLYLPSSLFMERDVFLLSLSRKFNIRGATLDPIMADGTYRPPGDFPVHDDRHIQDIVKGVDDYVHKVENQYGPQAKQQAIEKIDKWTLELMYEIQFLEQTAREQGHPDPKGFKAAVDYLAFNIHHDRGWLATPSTYKAEADKASKVPFELYYAMKWGGQFKFYGETEFSKPFTRIPEARQWLNQFWKAREHEEKYN